jgi:ATP-binding cassette, subfamily B, bacterial PglK
MKEYFKKSIYILGDGVYRVPFFIFIFILSSVLDIVGISLIVPYISIIVNYESFSNGYIGNLFLSNGYEFTQESFLVIIGISLIFLFVIKAVLGIAINRGVLIFCFDRMVSLRSYLMRSYQNTPYEIYTQKNSADYFYSVEYLANQFSLGVLQSFLRLVSELLIALFVISFLAWYDFYALIIITSQMVLFVYFYDRVNKDRVVEYGGQAKIHGERMIRHVKEGLSGLKEVRILGVENYFYNLFVRSARKNADNTVKNQVINTVPRYLIEFIIISFVVLFVLAAIFTERDVEDILPVLTVFGVASVRLAPSINQIISGINTIRFSKKAVEQLYDDLLYMETKKIVSKDTILSVKDDKFKSIELKNVSFTYAGAGKATLKNSSIKILAGESIGIIGPSGSGKTTVMDVLLGLLTPQSGSVILNEKICKDLLKESRNMFAYLPQEVFLIDGSLKNNIALGIENSQIENNKINDAVIRASLKDLVDSLPDGLETRVGDGGALLSGGQRQRVALARAFYHNRSVLVMDESTSALDNETEQEIIKEIDKLKGKKTMIVIAHRLSTIKKCDRVYELDNGFLIEHKDL